LGCASQFAEPYHGQSKRIERAFGFFATEFDKSFESYLGSNTSDRHDDPRLYAGSFDGAPARPIEELPTIEETRELFGRGAARRHQEAASAADRPGLALGINRSFEGGKISRRTI
jgi:hypothetical protein